MSIDENQILVEQVESAQGFQKFTIQFGGGSIGTIELCVVGEDHEVALHRHSTGTTVELKVSISREEHFGYAKQVIEQFILQLHHQIERILVPLRGGNHLLRSFFAQYGFVNMDQKSSLLGLNLRKAARGIILDPSGRVLLIQMKADPSRLIQKDLSEFWLTPGGKVEAHETYEEGLRRELKEEVGMSDFKIEKFLFSNDYLDVVEQFPVRLFNSHYLIRKDNEQVTFDSLMEDEKLVVLGYKWWSLHELAATTEAIFPSDLSKRLKREDSVQFKT
jgi:8-oxo-dGTP pyrophosphatase MutT (NUDIX family)